MTAADLITQVSEEHGVLVKDVLGARRWPELVAVRKEVAYVLNALGYSQSRIGRVLGNKDHTTVRYYLGSIKGREAGATGRRAAP